MIKKKILVVSPTPTHPAIAGNRKRIYTMLKALQGMGCQITFLLDDQEGSGGHTSSVTDYDGMRAEWEDFHRVQDYQFPEPQPVPPLLRIMQTGGAFLKRRAYFLYEYLAPFWMNFRMLIHRETDSGQVLDRRRSSIDSRYNRQLTRVLESLYESENYDAMLVEYVFMSRALLGFPGSPGVIDTHDVFSGRTDKLKKRKIKNTFFDATPQEEGRGLDRADKVIAIQEKESDFFAGITSSEVITVGHLTPYIGGNNYRGDGKRILFVGAGNVENIEGLNYFVETVFLPLIEDGCDFSLDVAGNVGEYLDFPMKEISCLGEVEDLADAYRPADLVVSPINAGTGLKIKIIESFAYGIPVIGTAHSLTGVPEIFSSCYLSVASASEFQESLKSLLENPGRLRTMHLSCREAVEEYQSLNLGNLKRIFLDG